jgi:outer membrane protein TolC
VIAALVLRFPALARATEILAGSGPGQAAAVAAAHVVAALATRAGRHLRTERHAPMSRLLSLRLLTAAVVVAVSASSAAGQPGATPAAITSDADLDADLSGLFVDGGLTADQAAARAATASPAVWRKAAEVEQAIAELDAAKLERLPKVRYTLSYTRLSDEEQPDLSALGGGMSSAGAGFVMPEILNQYKAEARLVVPLSDHFLRLPNLIDAARDGERAARVAVRETELDAGTDARLAYYEWVRSRLQLVVATHQLGQVESTLDQVRAMAKAQKVSRADLLRVESELSAAEQTVDTLRAVAGLREESLRLLIGAGPEEVLAVGEDMRHAVAAPAPASLDDLTAKATKQRLEFRRLELALDANAELAEAERANQLPQLSAFATTTYANPSDRVFPSEAEFEGSWAAGLQLTWSLNDALTAGTTKRKLRAEAKALRADRAAMVHATRLELLSAQQDVELAQAAMTTSNQGLVAAEESYRVRTALLAAERATAVELVDAETELTRARIAALDARIDLRIAVARLDHALGNDAE